MRTYYSIGEIKMVHTAETYDIERLRVEIARLREALEDIMTRETVYAARLIARAALAEKEK